MADGVVDFLEVVDVTDDQRERFTSFPRALHFSLEIRVQLTVVGDARKRVGGGELLRVLVGGGVFNRDHGLVSQSLKDTDLTPFERPWCPHVDDQYADALPAEAHRNRNSPLPGAPRQAIRRPAASIHPAPSRRPVPA